MRKVQIGLAIYTTIALMIIFNMINVPSVIGLEKFMWIIFPIFVSIIFFNFCWILASFNYRMWNKNILDREEELKHEMLYWIEHRDMIAFLSLANKIGKDKAISKLKEIKLC